uniref:Uncharacterized protein n=1 Tax=Oryza glumipatula TaxID=40148 RepID=A0A0D9YRF4_9ORYZ
MADGVVFCERIGAGGGDRRCFRREMDGRKPSDLRAESKHTTTVKKHEEFAHQVINRWLNIYKAWKSLESKIQHRVLCLLFPTPPAAPPLPPSPRALLPHPRRCEVSTPSPPPLW